MTIRVALIAFSALLCVFATGTGTRPSFADEVKIVPIPPPLRPVVLATLEAEYQSARRYDRGTTVPQNYAFAAYWYRQAANGGYPPVQLALARYYARGLGVSQDLILAYVWVNIVASQLPETTPARSFARRYRDHIEFKLPIQQLATAQAMSTDLRTLPVEVS